MLWIEKQLELLVKKYFKKHPNVRLVAVVGSVGKASTKHAIGTVLSARYRVGMRDEVQQSTLGVLASILGIDVPERRTVFTDLKVLLAARYRVRHASDVDVIVQELPTRASGSMSAYGRYLRPHVTVITAVSAVHMEQFASVDQFGAELFEATKFSEIVLVNRDDVDGRYADFAATPNIYTYGTSGLAEYHVEHIDTSLLGGTQIQVDTPAWQGLQAQVGLVGEHALRPLAAAVGVASILGATSDDIVRAMPMLKPLHGRMNPLRGLDGTVILDDTMSASPADTASALQALYHFDTAPQRIAILSAMNDLASGSDEAHADIGRLCSGDLLAWLIVVGQAAADHLAPVARRRGCQVKVARDAIEAAQFARSVAEPGAVILVKGSSAYYMEETSRLLCDITEQHKLVRQSPAEREAKDAAFSRFTAAA